MVMMDFVQIVVQMKINLKPNETLVLRTCKVDGTSYNNFRWPERGPVKCPDWKPTKKCGNGFHGALMGQGDGQLFNWEDDALWQVVKVHKDEVIDLDGKVKFPKGYVCYTGDRKTATDIIVAHGGTNVIGAMVMVGDKEVAVVGHRGIATAGDYGTATAGHGGTATAGYGGTATAGDGGTANTGNYGTATAGHGGTATAGDCGTAKAGNDGAATANDCGTATAGYGGTATAGYEGVATAGNYGTATAGDSGTATAGNYGTAMAGNDGAATAGEYGLATAGHNGIIQIRLWDKNENRSRLVVGYIGENGLEPNIKYKLGIGGQFIKTC